MIQKSALRVLFALLFLNLAAVAQGRVLVVKSGQYATLAAAVQAAKDGDTILVVDGIAEGMVTIQKSLTILNLGNWGGILAFRDVRGPITVRNLRPYMVNNKVGASFIRCSGPILVSDSQIDLGVYAEDCPDVTLDRCRSTYGNAWFVRSNVSLWNSSFASGSGSFQTNDRQAPAGLFAYAGSLFASACRFVGGNGRDQAKIGAPPYCTGPAKGGHGVELRSAGRATFVDCTVLAGAGGWTIPACSTVRRQESSGKRLERGSFTVRELQGPRRAMQSPTIARPGKSWLLEVATQSGDTLAFAIGLLAPTRSLPGALFPLHLDPSQATIWIPGPRTGKTSLNLTMPMLPTGLDSIDFVVQGLVANRADGLFLTNPNGATLLHNRF